MKYRKLGSSDLDLPIMGMGGLPKEPAERDRMIRQCLDLGINFFDTADAARGAEESLGEGIKDIRKDVLIATSFDLRPGNSRSNADAPLRPPQTPRERIFGSVETSLKKLQTDYVDLYHIHHREPGVAPEEILEPLDDLVKQGKVRYIGCNTYASWQLAQTNEVARSKGWKRMDYIEDYYAVTRRHVELEVLPYCTLNQVSMLVYHGLDYDFLTGKYGRGTPPLPEPTGVNPSRNLQFKLQDERSLNILDELTEYAQDKGYSIVQLAYAWLLAHPAVVVMTGADNPEQLLHNVKSVDWDMTMEERDEIDRIAMWDGTSEDVEEPGDFRREYADGKFGRGFVTLAGRMPPQR
jgi:aryl-alcohol dehydrogenase-like predicted oxidoreductase